MAGRMGTTPTSARIGRILRAHAESERTGVPVEDVLGAGDERGISRRALLRTGAGLGAGAALAMAASAHAAPAAKPPSPRVAIVGAGLAGVRAAHWLWRVKGIRSTVYEASTRAGGRCWSLRGHFSNGFVVEHGGSLVNTDHNAIRNLASNLGLSLDVVAGGSYQGWEDKYWIDGTDYAYDDANDDWGEVYQAFKSALASAPYCQTYDANTPEGIALDAMTVDEWIDRVIPGGTAGRFGGLMQSNVMAEYGLEPHEQSALNLVYLLGWNGQNSLAPVNGADEKYSVRGGNDQIVTRMIAQLPAGTLQYDRELVAVTRLADGTVRLSFRNGITTADVVADRVILALPFSTLRDCDLDGSGFSALKLRTIDEVGLGANAKLHVELSSRPWVSEGYGGAVYTDKEGFQCGWDDTAAQPLPAGIFNFFPAGDQVKAWEGAAFGPAPASQVEAYLAQLEPIFPGATAAYTGRSYRDFWLANPWAKGAYTCQKPGQYTGLFGAAAAPEGNVHFAGEHTSVEYYGFLNGAVESGERAAKAVALS
ncbi:flavin monoamine oxidase family protein [Agromyces sp. SYSU T0242]|uniref:flavin monoamine oxidase family protein n=1 Tax=Agromyces litoreus TaxID=3158561 RepID=UPI003396546C